MIVLSLLAILIIASITLEIKYSKKLFDLKRKKFIQAINKQNENEWIKYKKENFKN